jgi:hypothetical protein
MDPPRHVDYRRPIAPRFKARVVARMEDQIRAICREIMATAAEQGEVEFVHDVTSALPSRVIGRLMGLPADDLPFIHRLAEMNTSSQDADYSSGQAQASIDMAMYAIQFASVRRAEPPREDRIPQPTWQVFAPDAAPAVGRPVDGAVPPVAPVQPPVTADPQWPVRPDQAESPAMALLANRAHRSSSDALWAASAQEVLARPPIPAPGAAVPTAGVQPCSSCGLSLSATARFCRRCGTRQG